MTTTTTEDLLSSLDPDQLKAVVFPPEPLAVMAGAGSGKTRVLTCRVANQILTGAVKPEQMFVSAFTKAAATEMRERLATMVGNEPDLVVGTFHSIMFRGLQQERYDKGLRKLDVCQDGEKTRVIRDMCAAPSRDYPTALNVEIDVSVVAGWIGTWKNALIHHDDEEIMLTVDEAPYRSDMWAAAKAYPQYEEYLRRQNKIDFDDMLIKAYDLLVDDEAALERWGSKWSAFFVDEAQDTNIAQWKIIELLAPPGGSPNITVVGDTRQALYAFRGAVPKHLDDFDKLYPGAARIDLTLNYRSTPQVVTRANRLVAPLGLPDQTHSRGEGPEAVVAFFDDQMDQGIQIARFTHEVRETGRKGGEVAVLIRTNAQSAQIEKSFVALNLPYWCKGGGFFDRMEVGDMVAYLRLAHDRKNEPALRRIINKPTRYLGEAFCDAVVKAAASGEGEERGDLVTALTKVHATRGKALSKKQEAAAKDLRNLIDHIGGYPDDKAMAPSVAVARVLDWTEYIDWLKKNNGSEGAVDDSRQENLQALNAVAIQYASIEAFIEFIEVSKRLQVETNDATEICTVHRAKGREWPVVIVSNFSDGSMPHKRAILEGNLPDERRVAYVAFTRARDLLIVSVPGEDDKGLPALPSRFLDDAGFDPDEALMDPWWGDALKTLGAA